MKVVFIEEVLGTAIPGEVKDVKPGFARNYLFPRHLAVPATKDALQRAESLSKKEEKRQAGLDAEARALIDRLGDQKVVIQARVGDQGRLYGSVTAADIAARLSEILGEEFDRRRLLLSEPIRQVGERAVTLRLTRNVNYALPVVVEEEESSRRRRPEAVAATAPPPAATPPQPAAAEPDVDGEDGDEDEDDV
jgi:large subunit ribosomal protein L9